MECISRNPQHVSETIVKEEQMEAYLSDPMVISSVYDLDEEISTKKEEHLRLGPEDLNDTVPYEF